MPVHSLVQFPENRSNGRDKSIRVKQGASGSLLNQPAMIGTARLGIPSQDFISIQPTGRPALGISSVRRAPRNLDPLLDDLLRRTQELVHRTASQTEHVPVRPAAQIRVFQRVMEEWDFNDREAAILLGFERAAVVQDLYKGLTSLRLRDANDRLRAVLLIAADLDALYRDPDVIREWLNEPQPLLEDEAPIELLREGSMANVLRLQQYVAYLSGR